MLVSISMTAPPTGVLLASNFRCCKVARLRGLSYQGGGKKILRSYASSLCNRKNCYLYFLIVLFFWLIHFFLFPGFLYIYIVYIKFLLSLVTLICSYDLYYISQSSLSALLLKKNVSSFYFVSSFSQGYVIRYFLGWFRVGQNTVS